MGRIITGPYTVDDNFITIFVDNVVYTIARNTKSWASRAVGDMTAMGVRLTQEAYDRMVEECESEGTFELRD